MQQWEGIYMATVVNNSDPTASRRVIAQVPQVFGMAYSNWAMAAVPSTNSTGPPVGTVVFVMFLGGDPDYPVYFG